MTSSKIISLLIVSGLLSLITLSGQNSCAHDKIFGEWKNPIKGFSKSTKNIDSLRNTVDTTVSSPIWIFNKDGTSEWRHGKKQRKENYIIDEKICALIFGKTIKQKKRGTWYIIHLDDKNMLLKREIPNGDYFTYYFYRQ